MPRFGHATAAAEQTRTLDLERLVVLAITFRDGETARREAVAAALGGLADRFAERVLIHTCHRAELVGVLPETEPMPVHPGVTLERGAMAVERVLRVTAGLDSAIAGEQQLQGQVRDAYNGALARGETGPILNELFRRALRFGKHVRSFAVPARPVSLASRAVTLALERVSDRPAFGGHHALVVGTGEVGGEAAASLAAAGWRCTVASRNVERARTVVAALPGAGHRAAALGEALEESRSFEVIVTATRTSDPILSRQQLGGARPLLVDLSAPPAVDAELKDAGDITVIDLDTLGHQPGLGSLRPAARGRLLGELADERERFEAWLQERMAGDGIAALHAHAADLRERHLRVLRRRARLSEEQLVAVDRMAREMLAELLHLPAENMRRDGELATRVPELFGFHR